MKKLRDRWLVCILGFGVNLICSGLAASTDREITEMIERIGKVGSVCVEGRDCSAGVAAESEPKSDENRMAEESSAGINDPASSTSDPASGTSEPAPSTSEVAADKTLVMAEEKYNKTCVTCHTAGIAGAPKLGERDDWAPRVVKGMEILYQNSINGMPPGMPARGLCFDCSDDELKEIVDYMVGEAR